MTDSINWKADDGVFLPMLNDVVRNRFYESIIKSSVSGKQCVDIGFGTGILSMLALKHGADHVVAYEMNQNRFLLAQKIVNELGLNNRITLINSRFDHNTPVEKDCVMISETVSTNLWSEGMFTTMPRTPGHVFLPGQYFLELFVIPVSQDYLDTLKTVAPMHSFFAPGIDLDKKFVDLINACLGSTTTVASDPKTGFVNYSYKFDRPCVWGGSPFLNLVHEQSCQANYLLDITDQTVQKNDLHGTVIVPIDYSARNYELCVTVQDTPSMLLPRVGLQHGDKKIYLDQAESWGCLSPMFVCSPMQTIKVTHDLYHGLITYSSRD